MDSYTKRVLDTARHIQTLDAKRHLFTVDGFAFSRDGEWVFCECDDFKSSGDCIHIAALDFKLDTEQGKGL